MNNEIIISNEYINNIYGPFMVLENVRKIKKDTGDHHDYYKIQFKFSTAIVYYRKSSILNSSIRDPWNGINPNIIQYSNNYGPFKVLQFNIDNTANIQFIKTGNIKYNIQLSHIKNGNIKDELLQYQIPIDTTSLQPNIKEYRINNSLHILYRNMKNRCHNINNKLYLYYGVMGIRVCDKWLESFDNFYNDAKLLPQYEKFERWPTLYQLDKDYLQLNIPKKQRVYSPETCMFLYYMDNLNIHTYEYKRDHINELSSQYYGINRIHGNGNFKIEININNKNKTFGIYNNEIAAANIYIIICITIITNMYTQDMKYFHYIIMYHICHGMSVCNIEHLHLSHYIH